MVALTAGSAAAVNKLWRHCRAETCVFEIACSQLEVKWARRQAAHHRLRVCIAYIDIGWRPALSRDLRGIEIASPIYHHCPEARAELF